MAENVERFKKDLARLVEHGHQLELAMLYELDEKGFLKQAKEQLGAEKVKPFLKTLPDFKTAYEAWYSESIALLRQVLPDRVANFMALYEKPKNRKKVEYGDYVIQDYMQGIQVTSPARGVIVDRSAALPQLRQQRAILGAAQSRFERLTIRDATAYASRLI